jgi:hypothetical protein
VINEFTAEIADYKKSTFVLRALDTLPKHRYDLSWVSSAKYGASSDNAVGPSRCCHIDG